MTSLLLLLLLRLGGSGGGVQCKQRVPKVQELQRKPVPKALVYKLINSMVLLTP